MDRGGAERQVALLAAGLQHAAWKPHVILLTRGGPREEELQQANVPYSLIGKRSKLDPTAYFRLKAKLRDLRPDIVHTFLFAANCYGRHAAHALRIPVVLGSERCVDPWKTWLHGMLDRKYAAISNAITTNSNGVVEFYAKRGIPASLFRVIPNAVEPLESPTVTREECAHRLGLDPNRRWILAVGRLWPQKRYRDLIWAGEMINTLRGDDTTLIIVGDGPQRSELMRHRDAVSKDYRVVFAGLRDDVPELMQVCDAFWLASEYEGQSNALLEAMRAGLPCIASDIAGNRDLIEHDVTGALVPLGDSADFVRQTQHLWDHPDLLETVTTTAQRVVREQFTLGAMVDRHLELYETELSRSS